MTGDQLRPLEGRPYLDQWQKRLERKIKDRIIEKLQVLDEHDLMFGYPSDHSPTKLVTRKPAKVKRKKGKKAKR